MRGLTREKACAVARRYVAIRWRQAMMREQAVASRWAIHRTRSSASIKLLAMLTITSPNCGNKEEGKIFFLAAMLEEIVRAIFFLANFIEQSAISVKQLNSLGNSDMFVNRLNIKIVAKRRKD